ncbi:ribosomal protein L34 [Bogoriella caseilytica]|uniref:Large ribosomal subunit protein bL34 n=1 Tax=Bogoriella caseilytica TaxID=56055 RepID=A0A3N2BCI9_9MICO|nr:ribosomal protein L34 [Bogoriella caseilytica]
MMRKTGNVATGYPKASAASFVHKCVRGITAVLGARAVDHPCPLTYRGEVVSAPGCPQWCPCRLTASNADSDHGESAPIHLWSSAVSKRTFQPNTRRRKKVHGFRLRMRTRAGRAIVAARRRKGREKLTA